MRWIVLGMLVALTAPAAAATPLERFKASVEKRAMPNGSVSSGKWKALCVCKESTADALVGALESGGGSSVIVSCAVPRYNAAGDWAGTRNCYDWEALPK